MGSHTLTNPERFRAVAHWAGVDASTGEKALQSAVPRMVVSGRLASGKDTVAEAAMTALGCTDAVRVSFATPLRREVDELIDALRQHGPQNAQELVALTGGVPFEKAAKTAELLCAALAGDPTIHSYVRTREIRLALQEWGTEVRRASDSDYWVKQAMHEVIEHLAAGTPVYVTDARFINEVEPAKSLGFLAVRLEVELEVRAARLHARDGLSIDPAAENHPSEKELETYRGFHLWIDNSGPLDASVTVAVDALNEVFPAGAPR
jgi:hypothetical protein